MAWDELKGSLDFTTLRALYAGGELRPEDVVRAVYRRIAARGQDHVWIHLVPEAESVAAARRVAAALPRRAPLYGLPCAIKDNIDVPGLPSTSAFPPSRRVAIQHGPRRAAPPRCRCHRHRQDQHGPAGHRPGRRAHAPTMWRAMPSMRPSCPAAEATDRAWR